jgi:hypothetical protein
VDLAGVLTSFAQPRPELPTPDDVTLASSVADSDTAASTLADLGIEASGSSPMAEILATLANSFNSPMNSTAVEAALSFVSQLFDHNNNDGPFGSPICRAFTRCGAANSGKGLFASASSWLVACRDSADRDRQLQAVVSSVVECLAAFPQTPAERTLSAEMAAAIVAARPGAATSPIVAATANAPSPAARPSGPPRESLPAPPPADAAVKSHSAFPRFVDNDEAGAEFDYFVMTGEHRYKIPPAPPASRPPQCPDLWAWLIASIYEPGATVSAPTSISAADLLDTVSLILARRASPDLAFPGVRPLPVPYSLGDLSIAVSALAASFRLFVDAGASATMAACLLDSPSHDACRLASGRVALAMLLKRCSLVRPALSRAFGSRPPAGQAYDWAISCLAVFLCAAFSGLPVRLSSAPVSLAIPLPRPERLLWSDLHTAQAMRAVPPPVPAVSGPAPPAPRAPPAASAMPASPRARSFARTFEARYGLSPAALAKAVSRDGCPRPHWAALFSTDPAQFPLVRDSSASDQAETLRRMKAASPGFGHPTLLAALRSMADWMTSLKAL